MEKQAQFNSKANLKENKLSSELVWKAVYGNETASIFLSFDSKYAVVTSAAGSIRLLDAATGLEKFKADTKVPLYISRMDDGSREIFSFGKNNAVKINENGSVAWIKNIQTPIIASAVSQYSKNFILCYEGNRIVIADYNAVPKYKGQVDSKGPISSVYAPKYSGNFALVTLAGDVFYMRFDGQILWQYCISDHLNSVSVSGDGKIVFIGSRENKVLCLHADQRMLFNFELKNQVLCTDISEDGRFFAAGCADGCVYVFNEKGETIFYDRPFSKVFEIYLSDGANQILVLSEARDVLMYRICPKKSAEERSKDIARFIELDGSFQSFGLKIEKNAAGIDNFIEL